MSVLRIYVATVCLAATILALQEARPLLRARVHLADATSREATLRKKLTDVSALAAFDRAALSNQGTTDNDQMDVETVQAELESAVSGSRSARQELSEAWTYELLLGTGFLLHLVALWFANVRKRPVTTSTSN